MKRSSPASGVQLAPGTGTPLNKVTPSLSAYLFADRFIGRGEYCVPSSDARVDAAELAVLIPTIALWTLSVRGFIDLEIYVQPRDPTPLEVGWRRLKRVLGVEKRHIYAGALVTGPSRIRATRRAGADPQSLPSSIERQLLLQLTPAHSPCDVRDLMTWWNGWEVSDPHLAVIQRVEIVARDLGFGHNSYIGPSGQGLMVYNEYSSRYTPPPRSFDHDTYQRFSPAVSQLQAEWTTFSTERPDVRELLEGECRRGIWAGHPFWQGAR